MELTSDLLKLSNLAGIAGQEQQIAAFLDQIIPQKVTIDDFGNHYYGNLQTKKKKIALYAHTDEVGFFIREIDAQGFVYFQAIGGWWGHVMLGQEVIVTCRKNGKTIPGIIGTLPEGSIKGEHIVPIDKMYLDLACESRDEVLALGIQIGDMITPASQARLSFNQKYLIGKALDDRVGCVIMAGVLNNLAQRKLTSVEVIGIGTAQEEAGTRGSKIAATQVEGDLNFILDVADGKDTPKAATRKTRILGAGPGICLYDKTALAHLPLADFVRDIAEKNGITYQYDQLTGGGTDAGSVQLTNGKPTLVISLPVRYCHSWYSQVKLKDCQSAIDLLTETILQLDQQGGKL
ncbi:M42 family metallopeptidase [Enterococcus sp. CSURQ0835]|uniref:M42 family metallopeptidase n=1 Tax=Enterococcus sp. CSURQ0835 TaxID=2681394 RepID=UPI00135BC8A8|nr:M20/M25/M40 family metallo-hydrolase [Enterococcus sp. CSURQ0835]